MIFQSNSLAYQGKEKNIWKNSSPFRAILEVQSPVRHLQETKTTWRKQNTQKFHTFHFPPFSDNGTDEQDKGQNIK